MNWNINSSVISKYKDKKIYLFDSGVFARSEEIFIRYQLDFLDIFSHLPNEYFFITNEVLVEIANGPRTLNFNYFLGHILNVEGAMDPNWKENRFIIEKNGEIGFIILNKISNVDYDQVCLCQNHLELTLVSNDRKLLKSAAQVIPGRVLGMPVLIERLSQKYPTNKELQLINQSTKKLYKLCNSFDRSKTKK